MTDRKVSRRFFFMSSAATVLASPALGRTASLSRLGYKSPNEKLNIAAIGAGGKGASDIDGCKSENIVALCDADWKNAAKTFEKYPNAKRYKDFRKMLDGNRGSAHRGGSGGLIANRVPSAITRLPRRYRIVRPGF